MDFSVEVEVQSGWSSRDPSEAAVISREIAPLTWTQWFQAWIKHLNPQLSPIQSYCLGLRLTSDRDIQALNATYRQQNRPTDVLAFAFLEGEAVPDQVWQSQPMELGDIVISVETAMRQAQTHRHPAHQEIAWLATHGLLHLLGWDHPTDEALQHMVHLQTCLLLEVGLLS
ncbi:rRNA maturation RNase YbeY [Lyngbya confervoides]|uniref:Endoribonuclease YbeY n=1 Tax=Lyngbya confervoides BDU141951 TaxID=1574623 RepID=A0ABD4T4N5_9CYAN|nr:rRNA maturation RNase YbeY [Lyngbya confervoides]MCM1983320.1 rRNA maturation RNase YbeY [Lyngbya confervoides BDU141951]